MPRVERSRYKNYNSTPELFGKCDIWKGIPSRACMHLDGCKPKNTAAQEPRKAGREERSDTEKIGDIAADPKNKLMHYEKALLEYNQAAVSAAGYVNMLQAREKVLRIKEKIGETKEAVANMLVKRAERKPRKEAIRLLERALEVLGEAGEMHYKCGDLHSCERTNVRADEVKTMLYGLGWHPPDMTFDSSL